MGPPLTDEERQRGRLASKLYEALNIDEAKGTLMANYSKAGPPKAMMCSARPSGGLVELGRLDFDASGGDEIKAVAVHAEESCLSHRRTLVRFARGYERMKSSMRYELLMISEGASDLSSFVEGFVQRMAQGGIGPHGLLVGGRDLGVQRLARAHRPRLRLARVRRLSRLIGGMAEGRPRRRFARQAPRQLGLTCLACFFV